MATQQLTVPLHISSNDEPRLGLELASPGAVTVITIGGELDMATVHLLTDFVRQVARDQHARVVLDMAGVTFFGADGLRALIQARDTIAAAGGQLVLRAPSARTWRVLTLTGTDHLFPLDSAVSTATA